MNTVLQWETAQVRALITSGDPGGLIRLGRLALRWRQSDLGARIGCSASTVSRLEQRGGRHADIALLRQAAEAVSVPTHVLAASLGLSTIKTTRVGPPGPRRAEEDPMRRRTLLAAAGLAAPVSLVTSLHDALAQMPEQPTGSPVPLDTRIARARSHFDAGRHTQLLTALPGLLADAHHSARSREEITLARLSAVYTLASQLLTKLGHYDQSRTTTDRALVYADLSGSAIAAAAAAREMSIILRHQDQPDAAQRHITAAVTRVEATGLKTDGQASAFAQMLCTQAYTHAVGGDRDQALTMIRDAARAARSLPDQAPDGRLFPLTPAAVQLYAVGVLWALGDSGAALDAGRTLHPGQFRTPERKARLHTDMARVWWQLGKADQTAAALLSATRASSAEVRDRPAIHRIVTQLTSRHPRTPGVRELAAVVGVIR
ncbi:helix-turn-helix domain-containing protein [Streptomyces acidiscabies]|uniref:Helix-turn-helix transcriptional regulator n=1 Tax=Streptomyces acidiscabies TaxID=42234 RepID=A0ABU4MGX0_9ACTN|nr:helix-turn-helix transcriptional regulator [Streptomyces acidiscabies]MDX3025943.1 helix-turn-helix transcriptional regulator [Streptomyces acidiscabies]